MTSSKILDASINPGLHAFITGRLGSEEQGNVSEVARAASPLNERGLRFRKHRGATIGVSELDAR